MSEQVLETGSAARAAELLPAARFLEELRRIPRYRPPRPIGDPLEAAVKKVERNPAFAQSRLLTRILAALVHQQGEFRRAEVAALDADTLALVINLMDTLTAGTTTREKWICAADVSKAAVLGAQ